MKYYFSFVSSPDGDVITIVGIFPFADVVCMESCAEEPCAELVVPFRDSDTRSGITTAAVLSQQQFDDNAWHPVAFLSKALNPVERNYEIHNIEILAIIRGLEE
jgi:hypothetical protein